MHTETLASHQHHHDFSEVSSKAEKNTFYVLVLTAVTMVAEIIAGTVFGSMALLADGWHMGTHVAAFMITLFAYRYARNHASNPDYTFGTGKVSVLGGFASAVALAVVALMMIVESLERIIHPESIQFNAALSVAVLGLVINVASVFLLRDSHTHHHHHDHDAHHHHDHNLRAAYLHVLADALTSLMAIFALLLGKYFGWGWADPLMGIVGGLIITRWGYGLVKQTAPILLDGSVPRHYREQIRSTIEQDADNRIADLHVWNVGENHYAAIISVVTDTPRDASHYKQLLTGFHRLAHVSIEVNPCRDRNCQGR